jgi:hypothetical protein
MVGSGTREAKRIDATAIILIKKSSGRRKKLLLSISQNDPSLALVLEFYLKEMTYRTSNLSLKEPLRYSAFTLSRKCESIPTENPQMVSPRLVQALSNAAR